MEVLGCVVGFEKWEEDGVDYPVVEFAQKERGAHHPTHSKRRIGTFRQVRSLLNAYKQSFWKFLLFFLRYLISLHIPSFSIYEFCCSWISIKLFVP